MANDWQRVKLGDVLGRKGYIRGPFGSALKRGELQSSGMPVYEQQHAIYGTREFRFFIGEEKYRELSRFTVQPHDLIISCSGTLGRVSVIREKDPIGIISQALLILRPDTRLISPLFLFQILSSPAGFHSLVSVSTGSVQVNIAKRSIIENVDLLLPPLSEQRAIAHILGTLDDKIELNRRRNEALEAMARALFQDWFVDFGPVRAKMEGRDPNLPADLWQLFPDRLNDEGKPDGWRVKRVSEFLDLAYGKSLPTGKRHPGSVPVYGSGGITGVHSEALINGPAIIVGRKGTVGSLYWEDRPFFPIDTVFYVQAKVPLPFCYYLLESLPLRDMNTDAAVPGLNRENVYRLEVAAPPTALIAAFAEMASRFREAIAAISGESETLAQLRDTLLPKLISGEVRIKDAERFMEERAA